MKLNNFRTSLIIRIACLLPLMIIFSYLITHSEWFFTSIFVGIILIAMIVHFIKHTFKYNNEIENLLKYYEENNFSSKTRIVKHRSKYKEVENSFDRIQNVIQNARLERETQYNFLRILIENVPSGIITINSSNTIVNINQAAIDILHINGNVSWSQLADTHPNFSKQIESNSHVRSELINLSENDTIQISYSISTIKLLNETLKVVNFQNIKSVLDKNEIQAWNNLIRTMTHEIMNSVTPIISLAESGLKILNTEKAAENQLLFTEKNIEHLNKSFSSIYNKSLWLKGFVEDYRKLIRIPQPSFKSVEIADLVINCIHGLNEVFIKERIEIDINQTNYRVTIDPNLIEQVVLNILKNSIEALRDKENKKILVRFEENSHFLLIQFIDNGEGIKPENLSKVFIPFFSTKDGGSGIGLSLSKQIMQLHNGNISVKSENNITTITLQFHLTPK